MSVSVCHAIHSDHSRIADWLLLNGTLTSCPGLLHGKLGIDYLIRSGLIEVDEDFFDDLDERMMHGLPVVTTATSGLDEVVDVLVGNGLYVAWVLAGEFYTADIDFPEGLRTNYGIDLPVSPETLATAEIVTEELRLIERFFLPIKRVVKEGF